MVNLVGGTDNDEAVSTENDTSFNFINSIYNVTNVNDDPNQKVHGAWTSATIAAAWWTHLGHNSRLVYSRFFRNCQDQTSGARLHHASPVPASWASLHACRAVDVSAAAHC